MPTLHSAEFATDGTTIVAVIADRDFGAEEVVAGRAMLWDAETGRLRGASSTWRRPRCCSTPGLTRTRGPTRAGRPCTGRPAPGHAAVVTVLLEPGGAAANPVRECGWSALTAAIYNGHEELAEQLVEAGANAGHQCYGESMYSWAVRHGRARSPRFLRARRLYR